MLFLGKEYFMREFIYEKDKIKIFIRGKNIEIYIPKKIYESKEYKKIVEKSIYLWYKKIAKELIKEKVYIYSRIIGVTYNNIRIKDQKTRLGSCSSKKNLNFNFRIVMAPKWIMEYVVVHELCHLKQMNHSKLFWKEVSKYIPHYKKANLWIKNNCRYLFN